MVATLQQLRTGERTNNALVPPLEHLRRRREPHRFQTENSHLRRRNTLGQGLRAHLRVGTRRRTDVLRRSKGAFLTTKLVEVGLKEKSYMNKDFKINSLAYLEEDNRLEAKLAKKSVPESVWETYSSFANTEGGIILLGVEEQADHRLTVVGVEDAHKIIADLSCRPLWAARHRNTQRSQTSLYIKSRRYSHRS